MMKKLLYFTFISSILAVFAEEGCPKKRNMLFDQDFGLMLTGDDLLTTMMAPWMTGDYIRPWKYLETATRDLGSTIKADKDKFTINLDVQHFSPNEISVKTADGYVVIEAKHDEKRDEHGFVSRQFVRRYALPEGAETDDVVSQLSSDGILTITAPRKVVDSKGERIVPITQTGPVRKEAKESSEGQCASQDKCH